MTTHRRRFPPKVQSMMEALKRKLQRENDEELLAEINEQPWLVSTSAVSGRWYAVIAFEEPQGGAGYGSLPVACWGVFEAAVDPTIRFCSPVVCEEGEMLNAESLDGYLGVASSDEDLEADYWTDRARQWLERKKGQL